MKKIIAAILTLVLIGGTAFVFVIYKNGLASVFLPFKTSSIISPLASSQNTDSGSSKSANPIFYGVSVDMGQLLPGSKEYVIDSQGHDLIDLAHNLGVNMMRITNSNPAFSDRKNGLFTIDEWHEVLDKLSNNGIRAVILIETPYFQRDDYSQSYLDLINDYVITPGVLDSPAVYAIDIKNEPEINDKNLERLKLAADLIRKASPDMKVTIGGWRDLNPNGPVDGDPFLWGDAPTAAKLESIVDFYSIHTYEFDKPVFGIYPNPYNLATYDLTNMEKFTSGKPILIEEFGAGNGSAITDQKTMGSPNIQASAYTGVYQAIIDNKKAYPVLGSIAYLLYPRGDVDSQGWNITDKKGDYIYPAGYVLQRYAAGK